MNTTIEIQNLKCGGCANTITTKISDINGVSDVNVDVQTSTVSFTAQTEEIVELVKQKLSTIGYPAVGEKNSVVSKAKSFVSCASGKMN